MSDVTPAPASAVLRCRACGVPLTPRLRLLADPTALVEQVDEPYLPQGTFTVSEGGYGPAGHFVIHPGDLINAGYHPDLRRSQGCCGPSGCYGMNRLCSEGHEVATECTDCWMAQAVHLEPAAVLADPVGFEPCRSWLTWNGGVVRGLAESVSGKGAFGLLPVLADALEDAGCTDAHLLDHLRRDLPHQDGCWVADLLAVRE
jgi:hypothetical protein